MSDEIEKAQEPVRLTRTPERLPSDQPPDAATAKHGAGGVTEQLHPEGQDPGARHDTPDAGRHAAANSAYPAESHDRRIEGIQRESSDRGNDQPVSPNSGGSDQG